MLKNLKKLMGVGFWQAPDNHVQSQPIPPHTELIELLTGGCVFFPDDSGILREYRRGTVFWHVSGEETIHLTDENDLYSCLVFNFDVNPPNRPGARVSHWSSENEAVDFGNKVMQQFHAGAGERKEFQEYVYSTFAWHAVDDVTGTRENKPAAVREALQFIRKNIEANISLDDIAQHCGISTSYLFALFHAYLGESPHRILINERIASAKLKLAGSLLPIKEIAAACGFDSTEVFYRRFKSETGETPNQYRKINAARR